MFVYQPLLDTRKSNFFKNSFIFNLFFTSVNIYSSGLAIYQLDEPVKTSNNNGFSGSDDILYKQKKNQRLFITQFLEKEMVNQLFFCLSIIINIIIKMINDSYFIISKFTNSIT